MEPLKDEEGPWEVQRVKCSLCGHEVVSVHPTRMIRNGECSNCHHFTCEPVGEPA